MAPTMTAPITKAKVKGINEWTSMDHAPDCPQAKWHKLPKDQQDLYNKQMTVEQKEAFQKKTGAAPICAMVEGICCPDDLIVNAGVQSFIIGAPGEKDDGRGIGADSPRLDVGDRRMGQYYLDLVRRGLTAGLQQVKKVALSRLSDLEKTRQIRMGERPADWILKQRAKSARGEGPTPYEDKNAAMSDIQRAVYGGVDPENQVGPPMTSRGPGMES